MDCEQGSAIVKGMCSQEKGWAKKKITTELLKAYSCLILTFSLKIYHFQKEPKWPPTGSVRTSYDSPATHNYNNPQQPQPTYILSRDAGICNSVLFPRIYSVAHFVLQLVIIAIALRKCPCLFYTNQ